MPSLPNLNINKTKIKFPNIIKPNSDQQQSEKEMDDDHAAALLLASLKHHKTSMNAASDKRDRDGGIDNKLPPMKRRKIQKNRENEAANGHKKESNSTKNK